MPVTELRKLVMALIIGMYYAVLKAVTIIIGEIKMNRIILLIVIISLVALPALAQDQTGTLQGKVSTADGSAIVGAQVRLSGTGLIQPLTSTSNERGIYRFPRVAIGDYKVRVESSQYRIYEREGIVINIGATVTLDLVLQVGDFEQVITITGEAPLVDISSTDVGEILTSDILEKLPTPRFATDVLALTPGNIGGDTVTLGGGSRANSYKLDGIDVSDPQTSTVWVFVNPESIEEIEVLPIAGATADVGGFTGAALNMVTKSGGESFSGGVSFLYFNEDFTGVNTDDQELWDNTARNVGNNEYTFFLGGPIMKDKVWFFANLGKRDGESWQGDDDSFPIIETYKNGMGKISSVLADNITFGATWHYDNFIMAGRGSAYNIAPEATLDQEGPNNSVAANLVWAINDNNMFELKLHGWDGYFALWNNGEGPQLVDRSQNWTSGSSGYDYRADRQRIQGNAQLVTYVDDTYGDHEFKFGAEMSRGKVIETDEWDVITMYDGEYSWRKWYDDYYYEALSYVGTLYGTDSWTVNDRLLLNVGLRYERQTANSPDFTTPGGIEKTGVGDIHTFNNFAPRFGFTYQLDDTGKFLVRGSAGRYYEAMSTSLLDMFIPNEAIYYEGDWMGGNDWDVYYIEPFYSPDLYALDSELSQSYTDAVTFGLQYETHGIAFGFDYMYRQNRSFILKEEDGFTWAPYTAAISDGSEMTLYEPVAGALHFTVTNGGEDVYADYSAFIFRVDKRYSNNWQLHSSLTLSTLEGSAASAGGGTASQTTGGLDLYESPNGMINRDGLLGGHRPVLLKVNGTYTFPWEVSTSIVASYSSGRSWSPYDDIYIEGLNWVEFLTEERGSYETNDSILSIDARLDKTFVIENVKISLFVDVFNLLNSATEKTVEDYLWYSNFDEVTTIMQARRFQLGTRISF
jgi:hypothetical protein